jgi:hypothetical protein
MTARDHALPSGSVMNTNMINADRCHPVIARLRNVAGDEYAIRRFDGFGADPVQGSRRQGRPDDCAATDLHAVRDPHRQREEPSVMTTTVERRPPVPVVELKRAWHAVQAGQFRQTVQGRSANDQPYRATFVPSWTPSSDEQVLPVVRCASAHGATTFALALATAANNGARVVECSSATSSGLAAASTAELGVHPSGWAQGTRGEVLLQRSSVALANVHDVPLRPMAEKTTLTVLDVGWELGHVLNTPTSWVAAQVRQAATVVVVTCATVPGLRHLEGALALLEGTAPLVAVVGPPRKRWPNAVRHSAGALTRAADFAGRLLAVPRDRRLAVAGLDSTPLPTALLEAAATALEQADLISGGKR